jgi:hypothetical protein
MIALMALAAMGICLYLGATDALLAMIAVFMLDIAAQLGKFRTSFDGYARWVREDTDRIMTDASEETPTFEASAQWNWHKREDGSWLVYPVTKES